MSEHPDILAHVEASPFYDSHSHMAGMDTGSPLNDRGDMSLASVLVHDYLAYLAGSCSSAAIPVRELPAWMHGDHALQFREIRPLLDACRNLSTYAVFREGIRELHGFEGDDIDDHNWEAIDARIRDVYRTLGERAWQREVMKRCGVPRQVHICQFPYVAEHWATLPPAERAAQAACLRPSLVIDGYCFTGLAQNHEMRRRSMELLGQSPASFDEHLAFCNAVLDRFVDGGGCSVKLLAAYVRPLRFEEVPTSAGRQLYANGPDRLGPDDLRRLQDCLLWHVLELARERGLPLIVHTGYSIPLEWGYPEQLLPIFQSRRLNGLKVALAHAGWPNYESALVMARTWRNCYVDMSWNPLLSPSSALRILSDAIDILPRNKILIGTDTGGAESFCGTVRLVRRTIHAALCAKVDAGQFTEKEACVYADRVLWRNANEFFNETP